MPRRLFAIADLHLSLARPKPMGIFGPHWENHHQRIARSWRESVGEEDVVLVAGDVSWAMKLRDAMPDLEWVSALPGTVLFVKGNHDYWWSSVKRIREEAPVGLHFVQHDVVSLGDLHVTGTRLWDFPGIGWGAPEGAEEDALPPEAQAVVGKGKTQNVDPERIRRREVERLRLGLGKLPASGFRVVMLHYPPVGADGEPTEISEMIGAAGVDLCVYGHLHGMKEGNRPGADCCIGTTRYVLTSCDWLGFAPVELGQID